jgi:hypothetical protein
MYEDLMPHSTTGGLLRAIRVTWILFVVIAGLHLYIQHRMLKGFIADLLGMTAMNHAQLITAEARASKAEILAEVEVLKRQVDTIHEIVLSNKTAAASTQADGARAGKSSGGIRGGRRGKQ